MTLTKRLLWPDIIRIIAIYLVLLVHSSFIAKTFSVATIDSIVLFAFAKTCVPLFVMLSGSLLLGKRESSNTFFRKRFLRLLIPWSIWAAIYTLIPVNHPFPRTFHDLISFLQANFLYFWFFPMITGLYLLTPALRIFTQHAQKKDMFLVILLWFLVVSLLPYMRDSLAFPLHVDNSLLRQVISYSGYYLLGYFILCFRNTSYFLHTMILSFVAGILATVGIEYAFALKHSSTISGSFFEYISPNIVMLSFSLFGILLWSDQYLRKKLSKNIQLSLHLISSLSLGVYFIHGIMQRVFLVLFGKTIFPVLSSSFDSLFSAFVLFLVSFCAIYLLQKIPFLGRYIS